MDPIKKFLDRISYKFPKGYPDMNDEQDILLLENILQDCGMTKDRDYKTQYTDRNDEGDIYRPDVVIFLPEKRNIIIDSKVPMKHWYKFQNTDDQSSKELEIKSFIVSLKKFLSG